MILSIVIPCYNEEDNIGRTLDSVYRFIPESINFEVLVIDNGSSDKSVSIAKTYNARVLHSNSNTVGAVRNDGVRSAIGDILLFIDADVTLTEDWSRTIVNALASLNENPLNTYGSHCSVPTDSKSGILNKYWFKAIEVRSSSHVGTGHMLIKRSTFDLVGQFNENLKSGEDYDICKKIENRGGKIVEIESLKVFHYGYPRSLVEFYKRELWHGKGDWINFGTSIKSKVWLLSIVNIFLLLLILISLGLGLYTESLILFFSYTLFLGFISYKKFGIFDGIYGFLVRTLIFSIYLTARFFSFTLR